MPKYRAWFVVAGVTAVLLGQTCATHIEVGRDLASSGSAGDHSGASGANPGGASGATGQGGATAHSCQVTACQGKRFQCGDCTDNDGDGLLDSDDPDCTGPCDNTEDSYFGGIPGQNNAPCKEDCYFDLDTGSGNDQCYWDQECDPLAVAPDYPPSGEARCAYQPNATVPGSAATCAELSTAQASACLNYCLPITPNGCDCFGCCELPANSGQFVWIGSASQNTGTCDASHVTDPAACRPCTPARSCFNACDPCEVCVGRTAPSADCRTSASTRCPATQAACGQPGEAACDAGAYCITGCCAPAPL